MQSPTNVTGGHRINRLTAGAIGLALLATLAIGAVATAAEGRNDETVIQTFEEIRFLEENAWDHDGYAQAEGDADEPISGNDYRFLEENAWDHDGYAQPGGEADAQVSPAPLPHGEVASVY